MEKKEVWINTTDNPETKSPRLLPDIYLVYWKVRKGALPGIGKMMGYAYSLHHNKFEANWDIPE